MLDNNKTWYYVNGTEVSDDLGVLNETGLNITIDAKGNHTVGYQRTVIRQCTPDNKLKELFFNIHVL